MERCKAYYEKNKERIKARLRKTHVVHRDAVFKHYGERCSCCGETNRLFLTVDHINNDGFMFRKKSNGSTAHHNIYGWLVRNLFPEGYQILCRNCNWAKEVNGICPHQSESVETIPQGSRAKRPEALRVIDDNG